MRLKLGIDVETWQMKEPLRIAGYTFEDFRAVVVTLHDGVYQGRGEAAGVFYLDDVPESMVSQVEANRLSIESGISRDELRSLLPPGGARNAIDCALWELESKRSAKPVWELAGLSAPKPLLTTYTLGAASPEVMAEGARGKYLKARAIKLKLLGDGQDGARVQAVRSARENIWLGVDANQALTSDSFDALLPDLVRARVRLIEQPFPVGDEARLDDIRSPIPIAADESVQSLADLASLGEHFQVINIKLDKCGGLTEALLMAEQARAMGLQTMIGNMGGTSLAMAPAIVVGQFCQIVDLDGPLFLSHDRNPAVIYDQGLIAAPGNVCGWLAP